jgi:hypothetical protein
VGALTHGVAGAPTLSGSYPVRDLFFRFGRGLPLHKVHFFILRNLLEVATFPLKITYRILFHLTPLPTYDCCPELHPPMPLVVVLSFLKYSGCPPHRSFVPRFPSWCIRKFLLCCSHIRRPGAIFSDEVFLTPWHSWMVGHLYFGGSKFTPRFTISLGHNFSQEVCFSPCHCCTAGHLIAGDGQSSPGFTTCLDPSLRLLVAPRGQIQVPTPLL